MPLAKGGTLQEQEAISKCQAGEPEALGILFQLHHQAVFRTASGITRNYDLAEDTSCPEADRPAVMKEIERFGVSRSTKPDTAR